MTENTVLPTFQRPVEAQTDVELPTFERPADLPLPTLERPSTFPDTGTFPEQVQAGLQGTKSSFGSFLEVTGQAIGVKGLERYGTEVREAGDEELENLPPLPTVEQLLENPTLGNTFDFVTKSLARGAPQVAGVTAAVGAAVVGGVPAAATLGLVGLSGAILGAGDTQAELRRAGVKAPFTALGSGAIQGLLEVLPISRLIGRGQKLLALRPSPNLAKLLLKEGGKTAVQEGVTEAAQEGVTIGARSLVADAPTMAETVSRILNAGTQGVILGGAFGAASTGIARRYGQMGKVEPYAEELEIQDIPEAPQKFVPPEQQADLPEGFTKLPEDFQRTEEAEKYVKTFEKKPTPNLAATAVDILEDISVEELHQNLAEEEVLQSRNVDRLAAILNVMETRGLSEQQQENALIRRYELKNQVDHTVAREVIQAYRPSLNILRAGTKELRNNIVVTYKGPERVDMEKSARAYAPNAQIFVSPGIISTPVVQYAEGKYLIAAKDVATFDKGLAGVVVEEAIRQLPTEARDRLNTSFKGNFSPESLAAPTWTTWVMENLDGHPDLEPAADALTGYLKQFSGTDEAVVPTLRAETKDWLGRNAAMPTYSPAIRKVLDRLRKEEEPPNLKPGEEIATFEPALDLSNLTAADVTRMEKEIQRVEKLPLTLEQKQSLSTDALRFTSFSNNFLTLLQNADRYKQVEPLQIYSNEIQEMVATANQWHERTKERLAQGVHLGRDQESRVYLALHEATFVSENARRALAQPEIADIFAKHKVKRDGQDFGFAMLDDFKVFLAEFRNEQVKQAERMIDPEQQAEALQDIENDYSNLLDRTYFPLSRFGRFVVVRYAKRDVLVDGWAFREGDIYSFETFETQREQQQFAAQLRNENLKDFTIGEDKLSEHLRGVWSFPPSMLQGITAELGLTTIDEAKLRQFFYRYAPSKTYMKHLMKRTGRKGFSRDGRRTYADYFLNAANHIARVKHSDALAEQINAMNETKGSLRDDVRKAGLDAGGLANIHAYMSKHYADVMSPPKTYAYLNHGIFAFYFAGNLAQPLINMTQMGLVTFPYLSNVEIDLADGTKHKFGHIKAGNAIRSAYLTGKNYFRNPDSMSEADQAIMQRATEAGFLSESYATEVAATATADTLQRVGRPGETVGNMIGVLTKPFQFSEHLNRWMTAVASLKLTEDLNLDTDARFRLLREAVQNTHGELASWNRPAFVRGGVPSVLYSMRSFTQLMLYHMAKQPGGRETLAYMFMFAGLGGLPFADDVFDMADIFLALGKQLGLFKGRPSSREKIQEFLHENMPEMEDLALHGLSHYSGGFTTLAQIFGGPAPSVTGLDLSRQLGLSHIIPGIREFSDIAQAAIGQPTGRNPTEIIATGLADVAGAGGGIVYNAYKALTSNDPNAGLRAINALPTGLRRAVIGLRAAQRGEYTDARGTRLDYVDVSDPAQMVEVAAYSMGFTPTRIAAKRELSWAQREAASYWMTRKDILLNSIASAVAGKDAQELAAARRAIRAHNREVREAGRSGMGISNTDISEGIKSRLKNRDFRNRGMPPSRRLLAEYEYQKTIRSGDAPPRPEEIELELLPRPSAQ